jgi:predicted site-specific integrase-resolvase
MTILMLKIREMCECLQVSDWTLANWRREGYGPPYIRLPNNSVRYPSDGYAEWIKSQEVESLAEERGRGQTFPGSAAGGYQ